MNSRRQAGCSCGVGYTGSAAQANRHRHLLPINLGDFQLGLRADQRPNINAAGAKIEAGILVPSLHSSGVRNSYD
jgi:hypothetical protein